MGFKNVLGEVESESRGTAKEKCLFLAKNKVGQPKSRLAFSQRKELTFKERFYQRESFPRALQQHEVTHLVGYSPCTFMPGVAAIPFPGAVSLAALHRFCCQQQRAVIFWGLLEMFLCYLIQWEGYRLLLLCVPLKNNLMLLPCYSGCLTKGQRFCPTSTHSLEIRKNQVNPECFFGGYEHGETTAVAEVPSAEPAP